jgi:Fe2+-dicitrate sensor, membrane component
MSRENFHRLLERYLEGRCTPEEKQLIHHWYYMLDEHDRDGISEANVDAIENAIWNKICRQIGEEGENITPTVWYLRRRLGGWIAASVALFLVVLGAWIYLRIVCYPVQPSFASSQTDSAAIITVKNTTESAMKVILSDESLVELYPGAQLEYPKHFKGTDREVRLTGDAFFAVAANKDNPFWVFHEGMITKVLGTKFKIKAPRGNAKGEVIVYSGKVDVFYNVDRNHFVKRLLAAPEKASLTTNQKAVLQPTTLEAAITENPLPVSEHLDAIRQETFSDISMPDLAHTLSNLYALNVEADHGLDGITFTGDISGIGLFKQLDIICTVTNTRYEVTGTTISIRKK